MRDIYDLVGASNVRHSERYCSPFRWDVYQFDACCSCPSMLLKSSARPKSLREGDSPACVAKASWAVDRLSFPRAGPLSISCLEQEKDRTTTDLKRLKEHFKAYEPTLKELQRKYQVKPLLMQGTEQHLQLSSTAVEGTF